ncbi:MAG TPA: N-acetylmuramoyl-L-alanine amidase, partial [Solirubrobacteraceae bacterium]|nr:N-acetylmuramoyl-L-alanine amidase [Solirubrobacteraceae bacterium]
GADAYQLRLTGRAPGLRAHFVAVPRRARPAARRWSAPAAPAIVGRDAWCAAQCPPREDPGYGNVRVGFVHHTVNANDYTPQESPAIVLAICRYHRNSNGWSDVGYNFLVDRYGQVFEGRAGGVDRAVVGAQASGYNSASTGVANIGEFSTEGQTPAGLGALARLLSWKLGLHGVPYEGRVTVNGRTFERISGHRDANSTGCPGDALYAQLPELRRRVVTGDFGPGAAGVPGLALAVPGRVRVPDSASFTGTLSDGAGAALGGRTVQLQARLASGEWRELGAAVTGPDGTWALNLPTTRSGTFRAHFPGDATVPAVTSPERRVLVLPRVEMRATRARVRRGQVVTVLGGASPAKPAVEVVVWRRVRGVNRFAGRFAATVRGRGFRARIRVRSASLYRFQARTRADAANAAGSSNVVWVRAG